MKRTWTYTGTEFHLRPSQIVARRIYEPNPPLQPIPSDKRDENLSCNKHGGVMSNQSKKKLRAAIDWLTASAKTKQVYRDDGTPVFDFKCNFITLTLPATGSEINYLNFNKLLLHPFLDYARKFWHLNNYVWKIELQKNGNPHVHILTDTYINHVAIRTQWNRILKRLNVLQLYTERFRDCSISEYLKLHPITKKAGFDVRVRQWEKGSKEGWQNPNTTDVHKIQSINRIGAYVSKYMCKNLKGDDNQLEFEEFNMVPSNFRIWGCNQELSRIGKVSFISTPDQNMEDVKELYGAEIEEKNIYGKLDIWGVPKHICQIFYPKFENWGNEIKGALYNTLNKVLVKLQSSWENVVQTTTQKLAPC